MRIVNIVFLFFIAVFASAQSAGAQEQGSGSRGSIPEDLLRPGHGESPRYPVDTVIGELGRGTASDAAYSFANSIAEGFVSGESSHPGLQTVNAALREDYLSALKKIGPGGYRLGSGREEADGSVSFLIRFIGREQGITGELYIRFVTRQVLDDEEEEAVTTGRWVFEDLILDEARGRDEEHRESLQRFDFSPYERFF